MKRESWRRYEEKFKDGTMSMTVGWTTTDDGPPKSITIGFSYPDGLTTADKCKQASKLLLAAADILGGLEDGKR